MSIIQPDNQTNPKGDNNMSLKELHADLDEFNETRKTVNALLSYKRSLIVTNESDAQTINEIKLKALDAINNLFDDNINTQKTGT